MDAIFRQMKIRTKMFVMLFVIILITLVVGMVGFIGLRNVHVDLVAISDNSLPSTSSLLIINEAQKSIVLAERGLMIPQFGDEIRKAQYAYIEKALQRIESARKVYDPIVTAGEEARQWKQFTAMFESWQQDHRRFLELAQETDKLAGQGVAAEDSQLKEVKSQAYEAFLASRKSFLPCEAIIDSMVKINAREAVMMKQKAEAEVARAIWILLGAVLIGILLSIFMGSVAAQNIIKAVHHIRDVMSDLEKGDLTVHAQILNADEVGQLAKSFNSFLDKIRSMIAGIYENTTTLNHSSENLLHVAENMAAISEETNAKTEQAGTTVEEISAGIGSTAESLAETTNNMSTVAAAIEEMSGTIRNMASAAEQTSVGVNQITGSVTQISGSINNVSTSARDVATSVNSVATAVKEINISLNEISKNCERSIQITVDADVKAKDTDEIITKLNESSKQIGKIVSVINDIADQTNMLALNAAIEAAGAGEAGKGFAVVANEVKELAKQTAEATEEISQQIDTMKNNMSGAVTAVRTISEVIKEITTITNTIAAAVTEQSATTGEISNAVVKAAEKVNFITKEIGDVAANAQNSSRSIQEASTGVTEIARSASELSNASNEVAHNTENAFKRIREIAKVSQEVSHGANEISQSVQEISVSSQDTANGAMATSQAAQALAQVAEKLEMMVRQFKVQ